MHTGPTSSESGVSTWTDLKVTLLASSPREQFFVNSATLGIELRQNPKGFLPRMTSACFAPKLFSSKGC